MTAIATSRGRLGRVRSGKREEEQEEEGVVGQYVKNGDEYQGGRSFDPGDRWDCRRSSCSSTVNSARMI